MRLGEGSVQTIMPESKKPKDGSPKRHAKGLPRITPQKIQEALVNDGYSAGGDDRTLEQILTALRRRQADSPNSETTAMIEEVQKIIDKNQEGEAIAEDVLGPRRGE